MLMGFRRRYRTMEAAANRLQKEAKGYLDSLRGAFLQTMSVLGIDAEPGAMRQR